MKKILSAASSLVSAFLVTLTTVALFSSNANAADGGYCVVVSKPTNDNPEWHLVVTALTEKHRANVLVYDKKVDEVLPELKKQFPRYACFVAPPSEVTRDFVAQVHRVSRNLNDDPYPDVLWGILTGYDAANALRIVKVKEPLVIHKAAAGTDIALKVCDAGICYNEGVAGKIVRKESGKEPVEEKGPTDSTEALVKTLSEYKADLFVTSGHATERDWQIGYSYRNGQFRSAAGQLFGVDLKGNKLPVRSENPKVYLAVGNCLMGHINGPDSMALAFMNSADVTQMVAYTDLTWYGYAGWGMLDYFVEQPGRYTVAEAFLANNTALIQRLKTYFPEVYSEEMLDENKPLRGPVPDAAKKAGLTWQDYKGLMYDRDRIVLYGDPAWSAKMAPGEMGWEQSLQEMKGGFDFEIRPKLDEKSFDRVDGNGSQRGGRPFVQIFPRRVHFKKVKFSEGEDLQPVVTENLLLIPRPEKCDGSRVYRVVFREE